MKEKARIRYTPEYVAERRRELANRGLLQHLGNGVYVSTEDGERYLNNELDTGELVDDSQESSSA
jgi:Mn-dependent DtxR family transcriptional regulator